MPPGAALTGPAAEPVELRRSDARDARIACMATSPSRSDRSIAAWDARKPRCADGDSAPSGRRSTGAPPVARWALRRSDAAADDAAEAETATTAAEARGVRA